MLVLSRKVGESIEIGDSVRVMVVAIQGGRVRLGIEAPTHIRIIRSEISGTGDIHGINGIGRDSRNLPNHGSQPSAPPLGGRRTPRAA